MRSARRRSVNPVSRPRRAALGYGAVITAAAITAGCGAGGGVITGTIATTRTTPTLPAATRTVPTRPATTTGPTEPATTTTAPPTTVTVVTTAPATTVTKTQTQTQSLTQTQVVVPTQPAPTTTTAATTIVATVATTTQGVNTTAVVAGAAAAAAAQQPESESTPWGWIAFGILALAVLAGGIVWFVRRRHDGGTPSAPAGG